MKLSSFADAWNPISREQKPPRVSRFARCRLIVINSITQRHLCKNCRTLTLSRKVETKRVKRKKEKKKFFAKEDYSLRGVCLRRYWNISYTAASLFRRPLLTLVAYEQNAERRVPAGGAHAACSLVQNTQPPFSSPLLPMFFVFSTHRHRRGRVTIYNIAMRAPGFSEIG